MLLIGSKPSVSGVLMAARACGRMPTREGKDTGSKEA